MRLIYLILLLAFLGAVAVFAVQNKEDTAVQFLNWKESFPFSAVVGAVYVLGMFTGWTVVGLVKRSFQRATDRRD